MSHNPPARPGPDYTRMKFTVHEKTVISRALMTRLQVVQRDPNKDRIEMHTLYSLLDRFTD